ncbi:MAG TPA: hypothetical protein VGM37_00510 [Armatimonadota bacterium]|jgi:hypothetical protein
MMAFRADWAFSRRLVAAAFLVCLAACARGGLPTVSVTAEWPNAHEAGPTPGIFLFTRTGDLSIPLSVDYALSGSAARDADYLVWEPRAEFAAGSASARVAILPVNDASSEGVETVTLTIQPGDGYAPGAPASADIAIGDAYSGGAPGVWDTRDADPDSGRALLSGDIGYLDAWVDDTILYVQMAMIQPESSGDYALYIDVDQDPSTGDYRQGRVAGQDFRVSVNSGLTNKWYLYKLPTDPPFDPSQGETPETLVGNGNVVDYGDGDMAFAIPVSMLRNRRRMDVFAVTAPGMNVTTAGCGDRCPDYGALNTFTRAVVVRRPGVTQRASLSDPPGDAGSGFDMTGVSYTAVAGQFGLDLTFTEGFDPSDSQFFSGPMGSVTVDGDDDLFTGCFGFGGPIPTFGGDNILLYTVGSVMLPDTFCYIQTDTDRSKVYFGGDNNDASWLCYSPAKALILRGSLSLLDSFRKALAEGGTVPSRLPGDGACRLTADTFEMLTTTDTAPPSGGALDVRTGAVLPASKWNAAATVSADDPADMGGLSGLDWTRVEAEVAGGDLVVKGTLAGWQDTDYGNRMEVLLDTDMNAATGDSVANPESGGPAIGADAVFAVHSVRMAQDASVGYFGVFTPFGGESTRHDAAIGVRVNSAFGVPGWFVASIPLTALETQGDRLRFYLRSGYLLGPSGDVAPPQPLTVSLAQGFALADAGAALRMAAGLEASAARFDADADGRVTALDAVHVARKCAGLEPNP